MRWRSNRSDREEEKKKKLLLQTLLCVFSIRVSNFLDLLVSVCCGEKEELCSESMSRREASSGWEGLEKEGS